MGPRQCERPAHESRDGPPGDPSQPQAVGAVPPPAAVRRRRRAPHAPRDLRHPHRPRSSDGCGASSATTAARIRCSSSRSATIGQPAALASHCAARRSRRCTRDGSPTGERHGRAVEPGRGLPDPAGWPTPSSTALVGQRRGRPGGVATDLGRTADAGASAAPTNDRAGGGRHPPDGRPRRRRPGPRRTVAAIWPRSGARSSTTCSAVSSAASSRPTRSSSASTSAVSTPSSSCGFPGTISSFWQQVGRSRSRRSGPRSRSSSQARTSSTSGSMRHPEELFSRPPEPAVVNPDNPFVFDPASGLRGARGRPRPRRRASTGAEQLDEGVRRLVLADRASVPPWRKDGVAAVWSGAGAPAPTIGLRTRRRAVSSPSAPRTTS